MHPTVAQWALGGTAALLIGFSKTGMPGVGILVVPMLASAFGGRPSVGTMLPMLIFGDCFAVYWYKQHARWDKLRELIPWVLGGMALGAVALWSGWSADLGLLWAEPLVVRPDARHLTVNCS